MPTVPSDTPGRKHVSATQRFTDAGPRPVEITPEMALRWIGASGLPLADQKALAQGATDAPARVRAALRAGGYLST